MTGDLTTQPPRPEKRSIPWSWLLFGAGMILVVVLLTYLALQQGDVVWEEGVPRCPHCRSEVPPYSGKCATCRQGYDWVADERLCTLCLTEHDVNRIRAIPDAELEAKVRAAFPGDEAGVAGALAWFREIRTGECVACGGTGRDLWAPVADAEKAPPCAVCLGDGDCVLCDGNQKVRWGDADRRRLLLTYRERLEHLRGRLGSADPVAVGELVRDLIPRLRGYHEIEGIGVVDQAAARREALLRLVR